jgi:starvation-inducible outer membrane lipoprotein
MSGCAAGIPPQFATQVAWDLSFIDIGRHPEAYRGRIVALGGVIAYVEAEEKGHRALVSEVPFEPSGRSRPAVDQLPRGRFILLLPGQTLPSDLRPGAEVTVVGEILGAGTWAGNDVDDRVPVIEARHVKIWGPSWWPRVQIGVWGGIGL